LAGSRTPAKLAAPTKRVQLAVPRHPPHPSIKKKDRAQISAEQQRRLDRFKNAVALKLAFDGPDGGQHDEQGPPIPSDQVEQPKLWVHLRARGKSPAGAGQRLRTCKGERSRHERRVPRRIRPHRPPAVVGTLTQL
jgi:hypothetical protein